jgi:multidrug efflux system membrane fusion protein
MTRARWGSLGLALLVVVLLVVWMATGDLKEASREPPEPAPAATREPTRVQVSTVSAQTYEPGIWLQGQLEPWLAVTVSAQVSGTVTEIPVALGETVARGQVLARLSDDGRSAVVERWQARVRKLEADVAAARRLRSDNYTAQSELLNLESELAAARAELTAARLAVAHLSPTAPFDGIVNARAVDPGSLVQVGSPLFDLVRIDRLKATGQVPQSSVGQVSVGQAVTVQLLDGDLLHGTVTFVAAAADPETRSFPVEVAVDNPDLKRVAGGSASLRIALPEVRALFLSPAYLSLDDLGRPGVKHVAGDNRVVFTPVRLLSVATDGAWVAGLPEEIRLITRGGGFVQAGERVTPVDLADDRG